MLARKFHGASTIPISNLNWFTMPRPADQRCNWCKTFVKPRFSILPFLWITVRFSWEEISFRSFIRSIDWIDWNTRWNFSFIIYTRWTILICPFFFFLKIFYTVNRDINCEVIFLHRATRIVKKFLIDWWNCCARMRIVLFIRRIETGALICQVFENFIS